MLMLMALVGSPGTVTAVTNPRPGSVITIDAPGAVGTLDPVQATTPAERFRVAALFDRLVGLASDERRYPAAAVAWRVSPDSLTWRFTMRPGMTFTNGQPVSADAVARSWSRPTSGAATGRRIRGLSAVADENELVVTLVRPHPRLLAALSDPVYGIVCLVEGKDGPSLAGSGSFRLARPPQGGEIFLAPRLDDQRGRPMPAGIVVRSRPDAPAGSRITWPDNLRGMIIDDVAGTVDLSMAWSQAPRAAATAKPGQR